ncbi:MAG: ABC transporter substrate-binding protein [Litoreibacter sp.]|nr:ABC transporter substrate-binding protein [Litoreibacter sp.]
MTLIKTALAAFSISVNPVLAGQIEKIASAGGDITEILFEFGVGDKVVAADTTSIFPEVVNSLPRVGYVRELSAEGVLATGADLLIGSDDMGPPAVMDNLAAAGMRIEFVAEGEGAARYTDKVKFIGDVLDMPERGEELVAAYMASLDAVQARVDALPRAPRAMLILSVRDGAPIVAGTNTTGNDIIEISGGENIATFEGWKPMNAEAIIASAPEIIILSTSHIERLGGLDVVMGRADIGATPAGGEKSYVALSPQLMLQFGPRSPLAMNDLVDAFENVVAN